MIDVSEIAFMEYMSRLMKDFRSVTKRLDVALQFIQEWRP